MRMRVEDIEKQCVVKPRSMEHWEASQERSNTVTTKERQEQAERGRKWSEIGKYEGQWGRYYHKLIKPMSTNLNW